jgi:hypothetical protein
MGFDYSGSGFVLEDLITRFGLSDFEPRPRQQQKYAQQHKRQGEKTKLRTIVTSKIVTNKIVGEQHGKHRIAANSIQ